MEYRNRILIDKFFSIIITILSVLSIIPLFLIMIQIIIKGHKVLGIRFLTSLPAPPGISGGGILNALSGSFILVTFATVISVPPGILTGLFLSEVRNKFTETISIFVNSLQGLPSIVIGILAYLWLVRPIGHFSAISGSVGLAVMMLPMIIKSTEETLKLLPFSLKEAAYALGANYTKTIFKVIIPSASGGIISGIFIGISRIAGETAPLLFTSFGNPFVNMNPFKPVDALPLVIFNYAMSPYEEWHQVAWGAALVLTIIILVLNIIVKKVGKRWKIKF